VRYPGSLAAIAVPTLANAAVGSVPLADSGVAAGANNTLREAGGLFAVAVIPSLLGPSRAAGAGAPPETVPKTPQARQARGSSRSS
jgi:hypothetical protein